MSQRGDHEAHRPAIDQRPAADGLGSELSQLLSYFREEPSLGKFHRAIAATMAASPRDFAYFGNKITSWAANCSGENFLQDLGQGYALFSTNVIRSQLRYEKAGRYESSTYDQVFDRTYGNESFMDRYHWGVLLTTFAWHHHLQICAFFHDRFLPRLEPQSGRLVDLGCGSCVWSMLTADALPEWTVNAVDISARSIELARSMLLSNGFGERISTARADALAYRASPLCDAGISCFLLEHLEQPQELLSNLAGNLNPGGYAFITAALTAAEIDHIFEFRRESEVIAMTEQAGFRVIESFCGAPSAHPRTARFLPRSLALILQKRTQEIW